LVCVSGCFFESHTARRYHGREVVSERGHSHCVGCGHIQVRGAWYVQD
jgi:hypothetical protein